NCGRIYKIVPKGAKQHQKIIPDNPKKLVSLLNNKNGWVRDHAQHKIMDHHYTQLIPELREILSSNLSIVSKIHALWTIEGLQALKKKDIVTLLESKNRHLQEQALTALIGILNKDNYQEYIPEIKQMEARKDSILAPYVAYVIGQLFTIDPSTAIPLWKMLLTKYPGNKYVVDAVISSIQKKEEQ